MAHIVKMLVLPAVDLQHVDRLTADVAGVRMESLVTSVALTVPLTVLVPLVTSLRATVMVVVLMVDMGHSVILTVKKVVMIPDVISLAVSVTDVRMDFMTVSVMKIAQ